MVDMQDCERELAPLLCRALKGDQRAYARFLKGVTVVLRDTIAARHNSLSAEVQEDMLQEVL